MKDNGERPLWVDDLIASKTEWILYDSETDRLRTAIARSQKEAIKKALKRNIVPRRTRDIMPREGGHVDRLMKPEEFENFISSIRK